MNKSTTLKKQKYPYYLSIILLLVFSICMESNLSAQEKVVTGLIKDVQGNPVIGATITIKGTSSGVISDAKGKFSIKTSQGKTLVVSYIGFNPVELSVGTQTHFDVSLTDSSIQFEDVVVVGYGVQRKVTATGAVSQVKGSDLVKSPVVNMGQALTGRAAGVTTYQASGEPGKDDVTLRIRGTGTLNSSEPLVIVDGVERPFSQINSEEIESISVLKDAATTAVYGVRGANGVLVITTKKGIEGPARVSFSANMAMQTPTRMPNSVDGVTVAKLYNEAKYNDDPTQNPTFTPDDLLLYENGQDPLGHPNINWKEYMMKDIALLQTYNISVSGGTKATKYYTSVGYFSQGGLLKDFSNKVRGVGYGNDFSYQRINVRSNLDFDITPTTKIGVQMGGIISSRFAAPSPFEKILNGAAIAGPYVYQDKLIKVPEVPFGNSPLIDYLDSVNEEQSNTINTNVSFRQNLDFITKGLLFRGLASYDSFYDHELKKAQTPAIYNLLTGHDFDGNTIKVFELAREPGVLPAPTETWSRRHNMHAEIALDYKRDFNGHNISVLALGTLDKKWWVASQYPTVPISYVGLVARATYDYKSKYMLEFNVGYNGSENFAEGKRFALFPAISFGWNVAEEKFFKEFVNPDIISRLKLRYSAGIVGNDNTGGRRFMYFAGEYTDGNGGAFGDSGGYYKGYSEGKQGNPNVTWETATKQNYGVDITVFKDRLSITAEYFRDDRKDILATRATEPGHLAISGQDVYNIGKVKNEGFEIDAKWNQTVGKFNYFVAGNYSYAKNVILFNGEIQDPKNPQLWRTGHSVGTPWGFVTNGFYNTEEELRQGPFYGNPTLGDVRYVDINGDGSIDTDDRRAIGYPQIPLVNYGFSLGFSWKNFDFYALFQGAAKSTKVLTGLFQTPFKLNTGVADFVADERWTPETALTAKRPKLTLAYTSMSYAGSDLWTRSGDYLKLRNVEVAYTFKNGVIKKIFAQSKNASLRIYANGQNLFTWDKLKYVDPEANTTSAFSYPQLRIINFGVQLKF